MQRFCYVHEPAARFRASALALAAGETSVPVPASTAHINASEHNAMKITITQLASSLRAVKRLFVLTLFSLSIALYRERTAATPALRLTTVI